LHGWLVCCANAGTARALRLANSITMLINASPASQVPPTNFAVSASHKGASRPLGELPKTTSRIC
jgi:hypothetical protein